MRVLLVDPSDRGGIPDYVAALAHALRETGAEPIVLGSRRLPAGRRPYRTLRWLPYSRWGRPAGAGLRFLVERAATWAVAAAATVVATALLRPDVVHFQFGFNRRFDAILVRVLRRLTTVVWTAHDVLPFERTERDKAWFAGIYRLVDLVLVHSEPARQALRDLAGRDASIVPHAVRIEGETSSREDARARLGLPAEERVLVAAGFIRPYKGYELLADVWESLGDEAPLLLVVGELAVESERATLDRLASTGRVDLRDRYVPAADLRDSIAAADALLLPYSESSDSGLLHLARLLGTPVIASDAPQLAAAVRETEAGAVVPREVGAWREAVTGELPAAAPAPPSLEEIGRTHLEAYERARRPARRLVAYTDAVERGGAEQSLGNLLAALDGAFEVTVMGVTPEVVEWLASRRPGAETVVVPPVRHKLDASPILAHVRALRKLRPQLFHANLRHPWSCQYGLLAAALVPGTRIVAVHQALVAAADPRQRHLRRLLGSRVDREVSVGERPARTIEELIGYPRGTVRVIPHPIPELEPSSRGTAEGAVVGAVARLSHEKGVDILVRALAELPEPASAVVAGEGPERAALEELAAELGVADRVRFLGWLDDVPALLRTVDVLVIPSRSEAMPLAAVEAMMCGVPVVAAAVGGLPDVVIDGETGLLVPAEDPAALAAAIARVLGDADLHARLAARGREVARERFSPAAVARAFEALYEELLR